MRSCSNILLLGSMPDRIVYPAIRKMDFIPKSDTKDVPFFYHHDHDARHWLRQGHGRHAALYKSDRPSPSRTNPSYSATPMYDGHVTGPKSGMTTAMKNSDRRYASMTRKSAGRKGTMGMGLGGTDEHVGPGAYSPQTTSPQAQAFPPTEAAPGARRTTAAFANGELRIPPRSFMTQSYGSHCEATHAYGDSLARDAARWQVHANGAPLGRGFGESLRFARAPGPGSNLPEDKPPPGPGAYGAMTDATAWRPPARTGARSAGATPHFGLAQWMHK